MDKIIKPKLVFFQWNNQGSAKFYNVHKQEHVKCLSEFFEVTLISDESDYQQICEQYQPDITLFETGNASSDKRRIKNTHYYPEIPKLAFYNGDSFCGFHSAFLSDIENWGIETVFTISIPLAEYLPEIAENLFIWPNFIDPDIFRDYNQPKNIPVLITGSQTSLYPWRQKINRLVSKYYPTLICPHLGYMQNRETSRMLFGEQYARMINASSFSPTCGTMAREFVRKFLEIPGSKSCLITEKNPAVEAAGFVDMQNCVFADENDVLDKLDYLFQNPEELEKITNTGYQLVHSQHTFKQRDQIWQWFNLQKALKPNQRIVQRSPFEPLTIVDSSSEIKNLHIVVNPSDRVLLRQGDEKLWSGKYDEAEALYLKCLNFVDSQAQPKLRLALCNLYKGNAATAHDWIVQPIEWTLDLLKAIDPDPLEWAYLIITLLCQGKLNDAMKFANKFPSLCHPELDRIRWVVNTLITKDTLPYSEPLKYRYSAHQLPNRSFQDWLDHLCMLLTACQQFDLVKLLSDPAYLKYHSLKKQTNSFVESSNLVSKSMDLLTLKHYKKVLKQWVTLNLKILLRKPLTQLENRFGYFLPYEFSTIKSDEFFQIIRKMIKEKDIETALVIGASSGEVITEALLTGVRENPNKPTVFCINIPTPQFNKLQKRYTAEPTAKFYDIPSIDLENLPKKLSKIIKNIKEKNNVNVFDIILIDGSQLSTSIEDLENELYGYKFVLLDDINTFQNYKNNQKLLLDPNYVVFSQNSDLRNGYAIFEQIN
ncbi:glycosyltransferase [Nostoc sp. NZL]|uniref:glycosyltransferase n=1 Tax=Nostoc sp. NZL TaxID=2650612 RepID=UPI0018C70404|nr:glycosyltransferase [Nostoc sp. NZL]MBG1245353.1 glycosyltransferase family 1 protein [Nostoc sp. NZL]